MDEYKIPQHVTRMLTPAIDEKYSHLKQKLFFVTLRISFDITLRG